MSCQWRHLALATLVVVALVQGCLAGEESLVVLGLLTFVALCATKAPVRRCLLDGCADVTTGLLIAFLAYQAHDGYQLIFRFTNGVYERTVVERYDAARFRLVRVYAPSEDELPVRACPRVVDLYEWRSGALYYVGTDNWYSKTRVVYTPGHRWLNASEQPGYATHAPTAFQLFTLVDANADCNEEAVLLQRTGSHDVWHAAYPDQVIDTPMTGPVRTVMLDQVTVVNGWDDYWKERWWIYQHPTHGAIPIASVGWRKLPGRAPTVIWDQVLLAVQR